MVRNSLTFTVFPYKVYTEIQDLEKTIMCRKEKEGTSIYLTYIAYNNLYEL